MTDMITEEGVYRAVRNHSDMYRNKSPEWIIDNLDDITSTDEALELRASIVEWRNIHETTLRHVSSILLGGVIEPATKGMTFRQLTGQRAVCYGEECHDEHEVTVLAVSDPNSAGIYREHIVYPDHTQQLTMEGGILFCNMRGCGLPAIPEVIGTRRRFYDGENDVMECARKAIAKIAKATNKSQGLITGDINKVFTAQGYTTFHTGLFHMMDERVKAKELRYPIIKTGKKRARPSEYLQKPLQDSLDSLVDDGSFRPYSLELLERVKMNIADKFIEKAARTERWRVDDILGHTLIFQNESSLMESIQGHLLEFFRWKSYKARGTTITEDYDFTAKSVVPCYKWSMNPEVAIREAGTKPLIIEVDDMHKVPLRRAEGEVYSAVHICYHFPPNFRGELKIVKLEDHVKQQYRSRISHEKYKAARRLRVKKLTQSGKITTSSLIVFKALLEPHKPIKSLDDVLGR